MAAWETIERVRRTLSGQGLGGLTRILIQAGRKRIYLTERHVWYALRLEDRRDDRPIPEGIDLVSATEAELPLAAAMDRSPNQVRAWLADGHELWLMLDGQTPAFSCWIFKGRAPVLAARGGWLALPGDVACLEDSITGPSYRGRGIAPAAWSSIATSLHERGVRTLITKVGADNAPSRKACLKTGFVEIGQMWMRRIGPHYQVRVGEPSGATGEFLARALER